jgi:ABC transporter substrate binding protein (PQQ-dependent alcohol dehydrogenase system)
MMRTVVLAAATALLAAGWLAPGWAADRKMVVIGFVGLERPLPLRVGPLDESPVDEGVAGARLGIADNRTTGKFIGQDFRLEERRLGSASEVSEAVHQLASIGIRFTIVDLPAPALLAASAAAEQAGMTILNAGATDDRLRGADCRRNVFHLAPSRAMLADGLAQYLAWKKWRRWLLVVGSGEGDRLLAAALRRAADRFGAEIVGERAWTFRPGQGRSDTGHVVLQAEVPRFTRSSDYDVLVVADEEDVFGAFLEGRTDSPRPIAGTHGLVATAWSPVAELWGATQLQGRFRGLTQRWMTARDYAAWMAARSIGEAATRTRSTDPATIAAHLGAAEFLLAAFKGEGLTFRPWDHQLRQPILIAGPRLLVSVSPQEGFLQQGNRLDSLGVAKEETTCGLQ